MKKAKKAKSAKKAAKKAKKTTSAKRAVAKKPVAAKMPRLGKILHYYDKIGVAVVELAGTLNVGDEILIKGHAGEFKQKVASMQIEHEQVKTAKKGDAIGMKVDQPVKENMEVFKA